MITRNPTGLPRRYGRSGPTIRPFRFRLEAWLGSFSRVPAQARCRSGSRGEKQYSWAKVLDQISVGTGHPTTDPGKLRPRVGPAHQKWMSTSALLC